MNPPISRIAFVELIADVGKRLAGNWEIIPNPDEGPMEAHLRDPELHASLYFNHHESKIHVSTDLPKDAKGEIPYVEGYGQLGKRMPSINVSFGKTPQQIAGEIERRLMPEYMDILMKALARITSSDAYHNKTERFANEIAALAGVEAKGNKVDFYRSDLPTFHKTISRAEVYDDDVELDLRLSYEDTRRVLKLLSGQIPNRCIIIRQ